jgi:outer membrane protein assembly factor BamB
VISERDFDPAAAPSVVTPVVEKRVVKLPPARPLVPLVSVVESPLVLCDGKTLFAHDADSGKELWATKLGTPTVFDRVTFTSTGLLLALGDGGVTAAEVKTGKIAWEFSVPVAEPSPRLSGFTFTGNRLIARVGDHGLIALDLSTGKVAWTRSAANETEVFAYGSPTAAKFGPHLGAFGDRVYAQRDGECWVLDAAGGKKVRTHATCLQEWTTPPAVLDGKVILPATAGLAQVNDDRAVSFFVARHEASLSGAPPAVRAFGGRVFAVVSRR